MKKSLTYYRRLPYARRCQLHVEGGKRYWHAWIEELPGCEIDADTKPSAYLALDEVFQDYINAKLEWGSIIPEPSRWPKLRKSVRHKVSGTRAKVVKGPTASRPDLTNVRAEEPDRTAETLVLA